MIKYFEWLIAIRYLRSKRKESFISVVSGFSLLGIMLGVATLIVVMSVMNGFYKQFVHNILGIQGHITLVNNYGNFEDYDALVKKLNQIKGIKFVAPLVTGQGMAVSNYGTNGVLVRGISADELTKKPLISESITSEELKKFKNGDGIILGNALGRALHVHIGEKIKIINPDSSTTIMGNIPRIKTFTVIGFFDVGLYQYNSTTIFMPLQDAQVFFKSYNVANEIEIMVENPEHLESIKTDISKYISPNINIIDWKKSQEKFLNALEVERTVMFLILTLIIIVAAFNIISSLIMLVKDKSSNIAILRTMGASKASILKIFIISGSMIGIIGTVLGIILGVTFALNIENIKRILEKITGSTLFDPVIYFLTKLPSDLEISSVIKVTSLSILLSVLATIYPAWRAAKLSPAEILRYN